MNQRERTNDSNPPPAEPAPAPEANLNALRQASASMLSAADDAISRVLSGDSTAFNAAVQQQGGE